MKRDIMKCDWCNGTGLLWVNSDWEEGECLECRGRGTVEVLGVDSDWEEGVCLECDGRGTVESDGQL